MITSRLPQIGRGEAGAKANAQRGGIFFKLLFLIFLAAFCFVIYVVRHPLMRLWGDFLVFDQQPKASDAIVMLSDDNFQGDRATHAADLYKAGWAPRVIASGRLLRPYAGIAELEEHDLEAHGVPEGAIVKLPHNARDTREECEDIGQLITARQWKRIILVTSNYHTRRAHYICERVLPPGTILLVSAAPDSDYNPQDWWETRQSTKMLSNESLGLFEAMWELRHLDVRTTESSLAPVTILLPH